MIVNVIGTKIHEITMRQLFPRNDELHTHPFFELVYVLQGRATHHINNTTTQLRENQFFIIDTGTVHCYQDTDNFEIINCLFMPEYIHTALTDCPSLSFLLSNQVLRFGVPMELCAADRIFNDTNGMVGRHMRRMVKEYTEKNTSYTELLRCQLIQGLIYVVRAAEQSAPSLHPATSATIQYLQDHYANPLSLNELSRSIGYAPTYISGLFPQEVGMTVSAYLRRLRVEKATQLLDQTNLRLDDIASMVGYQNTKHFSLIFRQIKECSPTQWRKEKTLRL